MLFINLVRLFDIFFQFNSPIVHYDGDRIVIASLCLRQDAKLAPFILQWIIFNNLIGELTQIENLSQKKADNNQQSIYGPILLSKKVSVCQEFSNNQGTQFFLNLISAKDIAQLSIYPYEEEIVMLPFSQFEVEEVQVQEGQAVKVNLTELPLPRQTDVILWVDDQPQNNYQYAQQLELENQDVSVVFCKSTIDAIKVVKQYKWMIYLEGSHFRIVTDMVRDEKVSQIIQLEWISQFIYSKKQIIKTRQIKKPEGKYRFFKRLSWKLKMVRNYKNKTQGLSVNGKYQIKKDAAQGVIKMIDLTNLLQIEYRTENYFYECFAIQQLGLFLITKSNDPGQQENSNYSLDKNNLVQVFKIYQILSKLWTTYSLSQTLIVVNYLAKMNNQLIQL